MLYFGESIRRCKKNYMPVVQKAWKALASSVHQDGMPGNVQPIGAAPIKMLTVQILMEWVHFC